MVRNVCPRAVCQRETWLYISFKQVVMTEEAKDTGSDYRVVHFGSGREKEEERTRSKPIEVLL